VTLFHDKIFPRTFPWLLTTSLTFPWHVSNSNNSRFSRQVVTLTLYSCGRSSGCFGSSTATQWLHDMQWITSFNDKQINLDHLTTHCGYDKSPTGLKLHSPDSRLTDTYSTVADGRSWKPTLLLFWSNLTAPVGLSIRYTTADIVLEIGSTSATVKKCFITPYLLKVKNSGRSKIH